MLSARLESIEALTDQFDNENCTPPLAHLLQFICSLFTDDRQQYTKRTINEIVTNEDQLNQNEGWWVIHRSLNQSVNELLP